MRSFFSFISLSLSVEYHRHWVDVIAMTLSYYTPDWPSRLSRCVAIKMKSCIIFTQHFDVVMPLPPLSPLLSVPVLSLFLGSFWIRLPLTGTRNIATPSGRMRRNCSLSKLYHPLPLSLSLSLPLLFRTCLSGSLLSFIFMSAFLSCHIKLLN